MTSSPQTLVLGGGCYNCHQLSKQQCNDTQWQIHLNLHYIIRYITNKVCNVSDKYHIDNGTRTNAGSCLKEYNYKNDRIDKQLPRSKTPSDKPDGEMP